MRFAALLGAAVLAGCAANTGPGDRDGGGGSEGGTMDAGDAGQPPDAGPRLDTGPGDTGVRRDTGPTEFRGTCEACEAHAECGAGAFCISLTVGGRACVPGCNPDIPSCPRSFNCVLDIASGVDSTVCLPVGGACCVDEDSDGYGQGVGCTGEDCDDDDEAVNPGVTEICNGADDDCDGVADDPPTDCLSGRCSALADGTYEAVTGASCADAACAEGTTTACALYTCEDGGEAGNRCAAACAPAGTDDDRYCIATAHCDAGACVSDEPNGDTCDEDSDCASSHCDNGFCCDSGICCAATTDCPGGGGIARLCTDAPRCQGSRGETSCVSSQCQTTSGIDDDRACGTTTLALECGLFVPVYCTGAEDQTAPRCPTSCTSDTDCVDVAHCEVGFCLPDRPAGGTCGRGQDCQAGLFCVDGTCCTSACNGACQACNLLGSAGTCSNIAASADPAGECPGFSCAAYFTGFGAGEDACYYRQDVSDAAASCNGAGACISPATICPSQPRGPVQVDCNNTCEVPISGTCSSTTPGACRALDDPALRTTCGIGACARDVQRCIGGLPQTCTAGSPTVERCNTIDDNCDGTPDNGSGASLCDPAANVSTYTCAAGTCSFACNPGFHDINGTYSDGCECTNDAAPSSCSAALSAGDLAVGGTPRTIRGLLVSTSDRDWHSINFPSGGARGPGQGRATIALTGANAGNFRLNFFTACGAGMACGTDTAAGNFSFRDNASAGYTGSHSRPWPTTVVFEVTRVAASLSTCADASYEITISR